MNIAIIEDEVIAHSIIEQKIKESFLGDCNIKFFTNSTEFGKSNLKSYDVIVADNKLPIISGREILKSISNKTKAALFLLSGYDADFLRQSITEDFIAGFIDKSDLGQLIDHLKYINAKLKINQLLNSEEERIADNIKNNGCSIEINDSIIIIGLSCKLTQEEKDSIAKQVESSHYKGIVFFSDNATIDCTMLSDIVYFYKLFKDNNRKFCFWNAYKKDKVKTLLETCSLTDLIKIFDNINDAINYLSDNSKDGTPKV